jgi:putative ABC transport system substrate-binding protein
MRRRELITSIGAALVAHPFTASAQQRAMPVVALVNLRSAEDGVRFADAFRKGLDEAGYVEGQNVTVEYDWLDGRFDRLSSVMADLVRRQVAVIATPGGNYAAQAAKAATTTIPIVFGVGDDPVKLGLVANLARPGGNATGYNFSVAEVPTKRLELFHALVPKAVRIAMLVNPENVPVAARTLRDVPEAARAMGLQIRILNASNADEIEAAFDTIVRKQIEALFVAPDSYFITQRAQFATLTARYRIPATFSNREEAEAGGLMSYGTDNREMWRADITQKLPIDHLSPEAIITVYAHYLRSPKGVRYVAPN